VLCFILFTPFLVWTLGCRKIFTQAVEAELLLSNLLQPCRLIKFFEAGANVDGMSLITVTKLNSGLILRRLGLFQLEDSSLGLQLFELCQSSIWCRLPLSV